MSLTPQSPLTQLPGVGEARAQKLEKLGLVQRERSEADRRVIYVVLTNKCRTMREDARTNVRGYFSGLLDALNEEEKKIVLEGLNRLDWALGGGKEEEHET